MGHRVWQCAYEHDRMWHDVEENGISRQAIVVHDGGQGFRRPMLTSKLMQRERSMATMNHDAGSCGTVWHCRFRRSGSLSNRALHTVLYALQISSRGLSHKQRRRQLSTRPRLLGPPAPFPFFVPTPPRPLAADLPVSPLAFSPPASFLTLYAPPSPLFLPPTLSRFPLLFPLVQRTRLHRMLLPVATQQVLFS